MFKIYSLRDSRDGRVRYIGITRLDLKTRLGNHVRHARAGERTHKANWLRVMIAASKSPTIELIEETTDEKREAFWISVFRGFADLTNTTPGGNGAVFHSADGKRRIAEAARNRVLTPAMRQRISAGQKGKVIPQAMRDKISATLSGRVCGPMPADTRKKISAAKMGHSVSEETRAKIRATLLARKKG